MVKPGIWVQAPMSQRLDLTEPPHLFPTIPDTFFHAIGHLIVTWGLMEQQLNILLWVLLKHNGTHEDGWKTRSFDKRYDLLQAEWAKFSKGMSALETFPAETYRRIRTGKVLRDSISHKEMVLGMMMDGNHFVQFYNKTRTKQKSKAYFRANFENAAVEAQRAAGWFYWICQPNAAWPLPSPDTQQLRSLPNTGRLRLPT